MNDLKYIQSRFANIIDKADEAFVCCKKLYEENKRLKKLLRGVGEDLLITAKAAPIPTMMRLMKNVTDINKEVK